MIIRVIRLVFCDFFQDVEMMGVLGAGRGARERGGGRLEVEVNSKR